MENKILDWDLFLEKLVGNTPISNIQSYIDAMSLSIKDKLFFINKLNFDVIVDFGCADGTFLKNISELEKNIKLIGYDLDTSMINKAKSNLTNKKALLTSNWNEVINDLLKYKNPLLNLSSVIHEVYSYSNPSIISDFWNKQVFNNDFKWITIRDMIPSTEINKNEISNFKDDAKKVRSKSNSYYLKSFEKKWGSINSNYKTLMHYLLKYRYIDNWEREVGENYLPVSLETVKSKIPNDYEIVYEKDFILPFIQNQVRKDFNVEITHSTHTKMIIKNNKFRK